MASGPQPLSRRGFLGLATLAAGIPRRSAGQPLGAPGPPGSTAAEIPRRGGELVVATWDEPISLDPANTALAGLNPIRLIFDTLVVLGPDLVARPALAESWSASPDGTWYTFQLKRGVRFHDGTLFDAAAVKFNLDRVTSAQAKANFTVSLAGVYQTTEVIDPLTARVVLSRPYAPFLDALAEGYHALVSPAAVARYGRDFDRHPVGTGPGVFHEFISKSHVTVRRNPDYAWGPSAFKHQGRCTPRP